MQDSIECRKLNLEGHEVTMLSQSFIFLYMGICSQKRLTRAPYEKQK